MKDKGGIAHTLHILGSAALARDEVARAADLYSQSLALRYEAGDREGMAAPLEGLAAVAARAGNRARAARLYAAAKALREAIGAPLPPGEQAYHDRVMLSIMPSMPSAADHGPSAEGGVGDHFPLEEVIAYALEAGC